MFGPITRAQGVGRSEQVVSSVEPSVAFGRFCLVRSWQDAAVDLQRTMACLRRHFAQTGFCLVNNTCLLYLVVKLVPLGIEATDL